ncbi:type II restriction/modification system DNA methylase subunit YeeA [Nitrospirillum amazonense]|uniref:site-specific DNA-methyltransferase (adenine-specific) n=1 Tax=Nitrospirillum amazonense TaxID=28077 RepID=A0A560EY63_9PROT|nr:DNA methyltransferase [Nitrospirillum amazonense]TWB14175.1 type II restriction/modification system DNA methylase subunit YeeA [Nitrospirillum amazonense]
MDGRVAAFIATWNGVSGSEIANYGLFLTGLCDALDLPRPDPATGDPEADAYVFERRVIFHHPDESQSTGRIDLYKRGCFVLEAKQLVSRACHDGPDLFSEKPAKPAARGRATRGTHRWDDAMIKARGQAESYARALPSIEGYPPFLVVVDVGHSIELFADFTLTGKHYTQFPDASSYRVRMDDLARPDIQARLRAVWQNPSSLDPTKVRAKATREIAQRLALLAKSLERDHDARTVAEFLMRCLFTMFAEDVELLPPESFTGLLRELRHKPDKFRPMATDLWRTMDKGGFSPALAEDLLHFNGGLFHNADALPLTQAQLGLLLEAAQADWRDVEPAIFGTLLENALDADERHRFGLHYTPRAYVERLVFPTVIEPLREDWDNVKAAALLLSDSGRPAEALAEVRTFHHKLCTVTVLDPACGSANFLYVALEHMKRLEGEVLDLMASLGERQDRLDIQGETVDPHQFLGLEKNPRAAVIAELVLWIGYLQWHFRTRGKTLPAQPVLRNFANIRQCDALLSWEREELQRDAQQRPISRWDGKTFKPHPITGEQVPDEAARVEQYRYIQPKIASWPEADFIVGNPPFIAGKDLRADLGDGYTEALWATYKDLPASADYVMYWWHRAAQAVIDGRTRRFGFITTNSLNQVFSRRIVQAHLEGKTPLSLVYAVPDHPWADGTGAAAVRIAMTVAERGKEPGRLVEVIGEKPTGHGDIAIETRERRGTITAALRIGANVSAAAPLIANGLLSSRGVALHGAGFILTFEESRRLGLGRIGGIEQHIKPYLNGRDLAGKSRNLMAIDLHGLHAQEVKDRFPDLFQWILERVKPERDHNNETYRRENWWLFGRKNTELRNGIKNLRRYISTVETAKHRVFVFLDASVLPDNKLLNVASDDAFILGVLSSRIHVVWALAAGGHLGQGNDPVYVKTRCFDPFPFPDCDHTTRQRIRDVAEQIDRHRWRQKALHPDLTLTGMYNVVEAIRSGRPLDDNLRKLNEQALGSTLVDLHDQLDRVVAAAYGWPRDLDDEAILERLVVLNRRRAAEEEAGHVRWLRPEYQAPDSITVQGNLDIGEAMPLAAATARRPWPKMLPEQVGVLRWALAAQDQPARAEDLARLFTRAKRDRVAEVLQVMADLGQIRRLDHDHSRYLT